MNKERINGRPIVWTNKFYTMILQNVMITKCTPNV